MDLLQSVPEASSQAVFTLNREGAGSLLRGGTFAGKPPARKLE